jgi:hypothetical protein
MSGLDKRVTMAAGLALVAAMVIWWLARREVDAVRRDLQAVNAANLFLKKTLGDMTIAMTGKDREIDRLERAPCGGQEQARPGSESSPDTLPPAHRNAMVFTPDMSNRFRQRRFLHATLLSSSTM